MYPELPTGVTSAPPEDSLADRVATLENTVVVMAWLFAELVWKSRKAAAKQLLDSPAVRERLERALMAQMAQQ